MFGELLGLWAADVWTKLGRPGSFQLVECGPGRGTLMADVLRAAATVPGFAKAVRVLLLEISPALMEKQRTMLAGRAVTWIDGLDHPAVRTDQPVILLANEFLDALPVRQFCFRGGAWQERFVDLGDGDQLEFHWLPCTNGDRDDWRQAQLSALDPALYGDEIVELSEAVQSFAGQAARLLRATRGAALFIDYGYSGPASGDTLQALKGHRRAEVLENIGEADLTAHVDFGAVARAGGGAVHGPVTQGPVTQGPVTQGPMTQGPTTQAAFLRRLGIEARAAMLRPKTPGAIDAALHRLTDPAQMGLLFKVLALSHGLTAPPEGF